MRLFDTLSREIRSLEPAEGSTLGMYCCGPTVYGPAHLGNFRTFVLQDVLRRTLEIGGTPTCHVRNITDVDDKTIRDAAAAGESLEAFTERWTEAFQRDAQSLGCLAPHHEPRATQHIAEQVAMIEKLLARGHAYQSGDGSVYFKLSSYPDYGALSHLAERDLELGKTQNQRADADEYEKDGVADFVLWKARRPEDGEVFWQSPWGEGRPGWHLECSAMSERYLGPTFDLHSGGEDLIFPHHDNEIAQSCCSSGGGFARHWFHPAHLLVEGGKMSKSRGNWTLLADLLEEGWSASEVRYVLVGAHYRKQLNFRRDSLHAAREALAKLAAARPPELEVASYDDLRGLERFGVFGEAWEALQNDLNTPAALGGIFSGIRKASGEEDWRGLDGLLAALGLTLPCLEKESQEVPAEVTALAQRRWEARSQKDWAQADALREELRALGWEMKDGRENFEITPVAG